LAPSYASKAVFDPTFHTYSQTQEIPMSTSSTTIEAALAAAAASAKEASPPALAQVSELAGCVLLAALFLASGLGKISAYAATAGYMSSLGVPGALLPAAIALEVFGAVAIIVGWQTRITALLLAIFTLLTGFIFHGNFADQMQSVMFLKNVSIAGAFLLLVARGAGSLSIDHRLAK
jgi:putative oxidoreductase